MDVTKTSPDRLNFRINLKINNPQKNINNKNHHKMNLKMKIAAVLIMTGLFALPVEANYNTGKTIRKISVTEAYCFMSAVENEVMLEEWMASINYFRCLNNSHEVEAGIEISDWMYNPSYFCPESSLSEKEYGLTIQPWMSDPGYFMTK